MGDMLPSEGNGDSRISWERRVRRSSVLLIAGTDTLARATGQADPPHALLRFREPVAPSEAADREGRRLAFDDLIHRIREYTACAEIVVVEGAGGLLSPLTWERNAVDRESTLSGCSRILCAPRTHNPDVGSQCMQEVTRWLHLA